MARRKRSLLSRLLRFLIRLFIVCLILIMLIDFYVVAVGYSKMTTPDKATPKDVILCLGAAVTEGEPSPMLAERLDMSIILYEKGLAPYILLSGSTDDGYYNEVEAMRQYVMERGVPSSAILIDDKGNNTRASIDTLADMQVSALVVTQKYHLYRALYLGKAQNLDVKGVPCDQKKWTNGDKHLQREHLARIKDWSENAATHLPPHMQRIWYRIEDEIAQRLPQSN